MQCKPTGLYGVGWGKMSMVGQSESDDIFASEVKAKERMIMVMIMVLLMIMVMIMVLKSRVATFQTI